MFRPERRLVLVQLFLHDILCPFKAEVQVRTHVTPLNIYGEKKCQWDRFVLTVFCTNLSGSLHWQCSVLTCQDRSTLCPYSFTQLTPCSGPSWEADRSSANKESPSIFWNPLPSKGSVSIRSHKQTPVCTSPVSYTCHMPHPTYSSLFDPPTNTVSSAQHTTVHNIHATVQSAIAPPITY